MGRSKWIRRRLENARILFRQGGWRAVIQAGRDRWLLITSRRRKSVSFDGCEFDIEQIKDEFMRLLLLKHSYEDVERSAAAHYVRSDIPVIELGGCIGVVSCTTNRRMKNPQDHVVVEANPLVISELQKNRDSNGCQFAVLNRAIGYNGDTVTFRPSSSFVGNSVYIDGDLPAVTVKSIRLADIVRDYGLSTFALLCDIEGNEFDMIMQEGDVLKKAEVIVLESHPWIIGEERAALAMQKLRELGFEVVEQSNDIGVLKKQSVPAS